MPLDYQWNVNCQLTSNQTPIDILSNSNWNPIRCQLTSNQMPIDNQSSNQIPIEIQLDANWDPIRRQLTSNQMPTDIQSDAKWHPIRYQLTSNDTIRCQLTSISHVEMNQSSPNPIPMKCQSKLQLIFNWLPIKCKLITNWYASVRQNSSKGGLIGRFPL